MTTASRLLLAGLTMGWLAACQSGADDQVAVKGAMVERAVEASAVVESVDQETRLVVLERDDGTKVKIVQSGKKGGGRIELHAYSSEEMDRLYDLLKAAARRPV